MGSLPSAGIPSHRQNDVIFCTFYPLPPDGPMLSLIMSDRYSFERKIQTLGRRLQRTNKFKA